MTELTADTAQGQDSGTARFWGIGPTRSIVVSSEQRFGETHHLEPGDLAREVETVPGDYVEGIQEKREGKIIFEF